VCFALLAAGALLVAACGGGGEDPAAGGGGGGGGGGNQSPTISGTPLTSVMTNTAYSFQPTASDPNADTLTFSITGKPAWATFSATNGRLSGTPGAGDVATYANIQISVSDGTASVSLPMFSITVVATSTGAATLNWTAPQFNTDGSALTDLAGYRVYWGTSQNNYPNSKTIPGMGAPTSAVVDQLTPGTWYFVVTAYTANNESAYSNIATKTIL